ncbi:hypothetical protein ACKI2N_030475 [Cupriavidus sp. 30B13]|uniref:hypothetical protein n=1 Tax=Cupriavidus sp. 30B13 TaxID=3384241 RepID=UPI003B904EBE
MSKRIWVSKRAAARACAEQDAGTGAPAGGLLALGAAGILVISLAVVVLHYGFGWLAPACPPDDAACLAAGNPATAGSQASIKERVEGLYRIANDPRATPREREQAAYSLQRFRAQGHVPMAERAAYAHEKQEEARRQEQQEQEKAFEEETRQLAAIRNRLMQYPYLSDADRRFLETSDALDRLDPSRVARREKLELARQRGAAGSLRESIRESIRLYQQRQAEDAQRRQRYADGQQRAQERPDQEPQPPLPAAPSPAPAAAQAPAPAAGADRSMYLGG